MVKFGEFLSGIAPSFVFDSDLAANALFMIAILAVVSLLIFKFYNSISKRDLLILNLNKYNTSEHPIFKKVLAMLLYLVEYILFIPFLIWLWFLALSIALFLLEKGGEGFAFILLVTTVLIGSIRVLAYIKKEIAVDLAKLFPFITLSVVILTPGEFSIDTIMSNFVDIPSLINHLFSYLIVILVVEIFLRMFYTLYDFWASEDVGSKKKGDV